MYGTTLRESVPRVREAVARAAERSGRDPTAVRVIAVTKGHPMEAVAAALAAGIEDLGENRIEELESKAPVMASEAIRWHMIGHVQSRKASRVAALADVVHSVDSVKLARRLAAACAESGRTLPILIQVNTSGEASKSGFTLESVADGAGEIAAFDGLRVDGMMTMAPFVASEAELRSTFAGLRSALESARRHDDTIGSELSMGMSNDYEIAVEEGSTIVRLGTVLLGERPT